MDLFTIASVAARTATILYDTSKTIYQFVQATREVDRAISGLQSQVIGLAQVLTAISSALELPVMQSVGTEHHD